MLQCIDVVSRPTLRSIIHHRIGRRAAAYVDSQKTFSSPSLQAPYDTSLPTSL